MSHGLHNYLYAQALRSSYKDRLDPALVRREKIVSQLIRSNGKCPNLIGNCKVESNLRVKSVQLLASPLYKLKMYNQETPQILKRFKQRHNSNVIMKTFTFNKIYKGLPLQISKKVRKGGIQKCGLLGKRSLIYTKPQTPLGSARRPVYARHKSQQLRRRSSQEQYRDTLVDKQVGTGQNESYSSMDILIPAPRLIHYDL